jgi:hypothetical protein
VSIRKYFDKFDNLLAAENKITGDTSYRALIDMKSFIEYIIINELSKNNDGYKLSSYFYRPYYGTLHAGPVWDFDRAYGNLSSDSSYQEDGWRYLFADSNATNGVPKWWKVMMQDTYFASRFVERWDALRKNELSDRVLENTIDSLINDIRPVSARNFKLWPVFSLDRHGFFYSEKINNFDDEIVFLKNFILKRAHWMDAHVHDLIP